MERNILTNKEENMQKLKYLSFMLMGLLLLCSCPGPDPDPTPDITDPQTFSQTVNVSAEKSTLTITLSSLKLAISNINQPDEWCKVTKLSYTSGSPNIQLDVTENTTGDERHSNIVITDTYGNKVLLTVKQVKAGDTPDPNPNPDTNKNGIDDSHDVVSDQPAYAKPH